jgi:NAD(P)-dependent dehydrogenase (short-subunit alcohol dehydrogenase family)
VIVTGASRGIGAATALALSRSGADVVLAARTETALDGALATSLRGVFTCMKYEIPAMLQGGGGSSVNTASTAGLEAVAGKAGYVSSKFGVIGLTRTAALDYASAGIRVNALAPGPILTDRLERAGEEAQQHVASTLPMRRIGRPAEVAAAVVWLCQRSTRSPGEDLIDEYGMLVSSRPGQGTTYFQTPPTHRLCPYFLPSRPPSASSNFDMNRETAAGDENPIG